MECDTANAKLICALAATVGSEKASSPATGYNAISLLFFDPDGELNIQSMILST